jgi:outer membrane protein assembly factor BamB
LGGQVSYPLVVGDRVFVTAAHGTDSDILAIDGKSGRTLWGPIPLDGGSSFSAPVFDGGRVFAATEAGMRAFDPATGAQLWAITVGTDTNSGWIGAPPTAVAGTIYVLKAHLYAINERDGTERWRSVSEVGGGAPTVGGDTVYVSNICGSPAAFDAATGAQRWGEAAIPCSGGVVGTMVLDGDRVYAPGLYSYPNTIFSASTGDAVAPYTYESFYPPAFSPAGGFFFHKSTDPATVVGAIGSLLHLVAQDPRTGAEQWKWLGNGFDTESNAVVAGDRVYVMSANGEVSGLSTADGHVVWHAVASCCETGVVSPEDPATRGVLPPSGIAVGSGLIVAPVGDHLAALG